MDRRLGEHGRRIQGPGLQQRLASARGVKPTPRRVVREVVIERIVAQTGLEEFMPVVDSRGSRTRYPKFRWLFPVFYSICTAGFLILLLFRLIGGRGP